MSERKPIMTKTMKASEAREHFTQLLNRVFRGQTRILVEKSGIPVAGIVSAQDLERLTKLERERADRFRVLDEIRARNYDKGPDEVERDVEAEIAAMRQEQRERASQPNQ